MLAALAAGCLSPQEIELYEPPQMPNTPPIIELDQVSPTAEAVVCVSTKTLDGSPDQLEEPVEFRISSLRDANGPDRQLLTARWFLDYDPARAIAIQSDSLLPTKTGSDIYPATFMTSRDLIRWLGSTAIVDGKEHSLEVVVSDGFDRDAEPRNRAPKETACRGEEDADPCYATTYRWAFRWAKDRPCE